METADKQHESSKRVVGRPFPKGVSGNPAGRPKGQSLKEFAREYLANLEYKDKLAFLRKVPDDILWRMAEGNPHQSGDMKIELPPIPIDEIRQNNSVQEDTSAHKED